MVRILIGVVAFCFGAAGVLLVIGYCRAAADVLRLHRDYKHRMPR